MAKKKIEIFVLTSKKTQIKIIVSNTNPKMATEK